MKNEEWKMKKLNSFFGKSLSSRHDMVENTAKLHSIVKNTKLLRSTKG